VGVVAYWIGHYPATDTAADSAPSESPCDAAKAALHRELATAKATPGNTDVQRTLANVVVQNPSCFDPQLTAAAQTALDKIAAGQVADAVCGAADQPSWKC
jgi:hypothetical protein